MDHFLLCVEHYSENRHMVHYLINNKQGFKYHSNWSIQFKAQDIRRLVEKKGGILSEKIPGVVSNVMNVMNGHSMQTGVCTDHCNYGALRESSFLCRFICHINKGISSMYGG